MEILTGLLTQSPIILASIFFCIAAITKLGKETGAGLVLLGAIGMCALSLVSPIFYSVVVPRLMENGATESFQGTMRGASIFFGLGQALSVVFVAAGTLVRKPAGT